ncbi:hypothetical protein PF004_g29004 [Phytophthora fragariae]|uniref:Uncharacterized protein n=1 Tax=Phytophthora fragariae TaxID=53985 RepID=A0A6G0MGS6_9STRA|nr:hypothetical protein PF004_g29004 [Phytophthora fragariae]
MACIGGFLTAKANISSTVPEMKMVALYVNVEMPFFRGHRGQRVWSSG